MEHSSFQQLLVPGLVSVFIGLRFLYLTSHNCFSLNVHSLNVWQCALENQFQTNTNFIFSSQRQVVFWISIEFTSETNSLFCSRVRSLGEITDIRLLPYSFFVSFKTMILTLLIFLLWMSVNSNAQISIVRWRRAIQLEEFKLCVLMKSYSGSLWTLIWTQKYSVLFTE